MKDCFHYTLDLKIINLKMWLELCELLSENPTKVIQVDVESILRQGICHYADQVGQLWNSLAAYYIGLCNLEKARDIYEEGITKVITVRDFTQIFDAYSLFEESLLSNKISFSNNDTLAEQGSY
jgi:pre-mRNA-splicing factor SYF1